MSTQRNQSQNKSVVVNQRDNLPNQKNSLDNQQNNVPEKNVGQKHPKDQDNTNQKNNSNVDSGEEEKSIKSSSSYQQQSRSVSQLDSQRGSDNENSEQEDINSFKSQHNISLSADSTKLNQKPSQNRKEFLTIDTDQAINMDESKENNRVMIVSALKVTEEQNSKYSNYNKEKSKDERRQRNTLLILTKKEYSEQIKDDDAVPLKRVGVESMLIFNDEGQQFKLQSLISRYELMLNQTTNEQDKIRINTQLQHLKQKITQEKVNPTTDYLNQIYLFYARQNITARKQTFAELHQRQSTMNIAKFMYFCRDFGLIELKCSVESVAEICEHKLNSKCKMNTQSPDLKKKIMKYPVAEGKPNTSKKLSEIVKKSSLSPSEITKQEFQVCLEKIGQLLFANGLEQLDFEQQYPPSPYQVLLAYLGVNKSLEFLKKMQVISLFDMRHQSQDIQVKVKTKAHTVVLRELSPTLSKLKVRDISLRQRQMEPKINITWENLMQIRVESLVDNFDPRHLLQHSDFDDEEDQFYLQEYSLQKSAKNTITTQPKNPLIKILDGRDLKVVPHQRSRITNHRGVGYSQRYGGIGSTLTQDIQIKVGYNYRTGSSQRSGVEIGQEIQARAKQIQLLQNQKEALLYNQVIKTQDNKISRNNMK